MRGWQNFSKWHWLIIFLVASVALRLFSFFPSVLDHDESTYMVIARDMFFEGKVLYHDVIDTKPPGIFLLYGLIQLITGSSIFFFRLITAFFVGFTAFFIMLASKKLHGSVSASIASGFMYLVFVSVWKFFGMSPNTELFFTFFNILGILLILKEKTSYIFLGGLAFGTGFIIKYSNLFDYIPIVFFLLLVRNFKSTGYYSLFKKLAAVGFGFLIPFLAINCWYLINGYFDAFLFYIYHVPLNYSSGYDWQGVSDRMIDFHAFFAPIIILFYYVLFKPYRDYGFLKLFISVWLLFVCYSIISLGNTFPHYFIQLMLPVSILAGLFFQPDFPKPDFLKHRYLKPILITFAIIFVTGKSIADFQEYVKKPDYAEQIADYIDENTTNSDVIYTGNYHQIIYFLTENESPTAYVHWTILFYERLQQVMKINNHKELNEIFAQKPKYVVIDGELKEPFYHHLKSLLAKSYRVEKKFGKKLRVYKLNRDL